MAVHAITSQLLHRYSGQWSPTLTSLVGNEDATTPNTVLDNTKLHSHCSGHSHHNWQCSPHLLCCCRDSQGIGHPPFSVFVGGEDVTTPNTYTVLDNTNCTATAEAFTQNAESLAVPCSRVGRYVVIKATGGPLVLCEVSVYGNLTLRRLGCNFCVT